MADTVRYYGTGKRKNAIARVWLFEGDGSIEVNKKGVLEYFCRRTLEALINQPFQVTQTEGRYSVMAKTLGAGIYGQDGALRHGITKAPLEADPALRKTLRRGGVLTRDPRVKERTKYGLKRAPRGFQSSKR